MASLYERNGSYCVVYSYVDKNGKRKQKWETYKTEQEAKRRKNEIEYRMGQGDFVVPQCKTLKELLKEYVELYGKEKWALSTYTSNVALINNYIIPIIGDDKLEDINTRFMERYYQRLLMTPAVSNPMTGKPREEFVPAGTIGRIDRLLHSAFQQALKWDMITKNPTEFATVPKYKSEKREIWTADVLMHALDVCDDDRLKLALNLAFSCSLRMGELLGLTWDCIDISEEAIAEGRACLNVNKEIQRVPKEAIQDLNGKDVILVFPEESKATKTVRVLKLPKTESSIRKIFLPKTVALMLVKWKEGQEELKEILGGEYQDYGLVISNMYGMPIESGAIRKSLQKLIKEHDLPPVVFHSLRHTSVTYKLKLNGGDIKAVQGDSGHAQVNMVTDVYSHIIDDDRRQNAELFEEAFYKGRNLDPTMRPVAKKNIVELPTEADAELLSKVLSNPEMTALLTALAKSLENQK